MSDKNNQSEQPKKETAIDMDGIWKAAAALWKDDTVTNALSGLKQLDFTTSDLNMDGILKKYSEETSNKLEELTKQVGIMNKQIEELNEKVEEFKNRYNDGQDQ